MKRGMIVTSKELEIFFPILFFNHLLSLKEIENFASNLIYDFHALYLKSIVVIKKIISFKHYIYRYTKYIGI